MRKTFLAIERRTTAMALSLACLMLMSHAILCARVRVALLMRMLRLNPLIR